MTSTQKFRLACLLIAAVLTYVALSEYSLSSRAKSTPQQMTCAKLAEAGPGDNAHIELGEFHLCENTYVFEEEDGKWTTVWVPVVPRNGEYHQRILELLDEGVRREDLPEPDDVRIVARLSGVHSPQDVARVGRQSTLKGMVVNRISSLGGEEKELLREGYPGVSFDHCWFFHEGRTPTKGSTILLALLGALAAALIGLWPFLSRLWRDEGTVTMTVPSMPVRQSNPLMRPPRQQPAPTPAGPARDTTIGERPKQARPRVPPRDSREHW
ncbi:MAG: hypothetical protein ACYSX0_21790 [Planctomycetota bacterium]|jgi:hypothetical protein